MKRLLSRFLFYLLSYGILLPLVTLIAILEWIAAKVACLCGLRNWN
jgi:hypothetical protein